MTMDNPDQPGAAVRCRADALTAAIQAITEHGGSTTDEARLVATNLVEANLRGHDSHGVGMVPRYIDSLVEGGLTINQKIEIRLDNGALLALDGGQGYGQSIGRQAMALGIERARAHGFALVALANSHHLGRIGHWAEQVVGAGLISIHFVNVIARPIVAPFGGRDARFGTNPVTIGMPVAGREPFILDFATARIAQGKIRVAHNKGQSLAPGILLDDAGEPTTDPRYAVIEPLGAITTFGEHKGYGLAIACELLAGALTGALTQRTANTGARQVLNGMLTIIVDPAGLGTADHFASEARAFVDWLLAARPQAGVDAVLLAGDPERATRASRLARGIDVDPTTWAELRAAAGKVGLEAARFEALARG
jgi:hydroxycarboxylate dehydrogenase B